MKTSRVALLALGVWMAVALVASGKRTLAISQAVALFDASAPLAEMEQFIPEKPVAIHPAKESQVERKGALRGPGTGLGGTPPAIPAARGGGGSGRGARGGRAPGTASAVPAIIAPPVPTISGPGAAAEQNTQGSRPALPVIESFDGLGEGFSQYKFPTRVQGEYTGGAGRGGIDISIAAGPDHLVEILDGRTAVFTKKGKKFPSSGRLLYGPVPNNTIFAGFGVRCSASNNSDSVVRYDQLADRWLIVVPVFSQPYAMCYAVSATSDPLGSYYRYEFARPLFPDYPRPAIWPDGYYNPTSTSDNMLPEIVTQKHDCIADRNKMLKGLPATEQCVVIDGAVFLLNADLQGKRLPPKGAPNIMMSTGGTQLLKIFKDEAIYFYKVHVDWA